MFSTGRKTEHLCTACRTVHSGEPGEIKPHGLLPGIFSQNTAELADKARCCGEIREKEGRDTDWGNNSSF